MDCTNCPYAEKIERLDNELRELKKESGDYGKAIVKLETKMDIAIGGIEKLQIQIQKLSELPTKRWDSIVTAAITGIVSSIVVAVMALILVKTKH